jgi:glycosyltransferase involved in cell wall biosynthesis
MARPQRATLHAVFIGDGALRAELGGLATSLGVASRVHFVGEISEMPEVYRDLDALALTSWSEGTPMSLLEGMACRLPIVATAVGGVPALLGDGEFGALVPPGDVTSLAAALSTLVDQPEAAAAMAGRARAAATHRYSVALTIDRHEAMYRRLLAAPATHRRH